VADTKALLGQHVPQARQMLRKLLVDKLAFTPVEEKGQKGYRFAGAVNFGRLLAGDALPPTVVAPTGFGRWWRDSLAFAAEGRALVAA
jgi:hypothetical protein